MYAENGDSLVYVDSLCEQATREEDNGTEEWSHRYLPFFELRREKKEAEKARFRHTAYEIGDYETSTTTVPTPDFIFPEVEQHINRINNGAAPLPPDIRPFFIPIGPPQQNGAPPIFLLPPPTLSS